MNQHPERQEIISFLKQLRDQLIYSFEKLENGEKFQRTDWKYHYEGGGEISILRGKNFEKAAVNWSGVGGPAFPHADGHGPFFATGISVITHMYNPNAPTVHMNIRFIETENKFWFGGGYDLTPMGVQFEEDALHFHKVAKTVLGDQLYSEFSQNAKNYFYIPHRNKERGVGGIFFDHHNTGDFKRDKKLWEDLGNSFLDAILPIYDKRIHLPFAAEQKEQQLKLRAHYAEFNLMYDRGTKFGFQSGGNPEAILCSMPPLVKW